MIISFPRRLTVLGGGYHRQWYSNCIGSSAAWCSYANEAKRASLTADADPVTWWLWLVFRMLETLDAHSGYNFPLSPFQMLATIQGGADRYIVSISFSEVAVDTTTTTRTTSETLDRSSCFGIGFAVRTGPILLGERRRMLEASPLFLVLSHRLSGI